ncbi:MULTISPECIES: aminoglycoside phosphotransferase family protein [unclassified Pseudomonas]|uniref:aminoglycoside phosphotransferase family protein n=1 Tax=unclassified Pseudomonas TaxID=196821 RepID=UPI000C88E126|nr:MULTISPECIES: aminoglycoside phosphotransferase family protein [unclassified Pseudomonas]PMZ92785.1 APH(6) family putative aminoglycoside O-phosphotransferase [Pseudomonas sp. FW305-42]PNA27295.1 APH(6) family putative aminoglycoside O-phosphotransferase [Pseudomonas sp. MPR-R1B]PNB20426.1 APH(6) family putative aminoglycoside O-phosphotransferase [Pseudomonas sp. DP16D-E2]PNB43569.1 APH(6) family putative aminoglycoside O-phosphotransferase [Pseudomonas sp. FW305-17]PNB61280.1 APH(6) famil
MFDQYLKQWGLTIDGEAFVSLNGNLLPVRQGDTPAMLKVSQAPEEQAGSQLMAWWAGDGAAPVLAHAGEALLMKRAQGSASLAKMVADGRDDEATRILCAVAARLHAPRSTPRPALVPLEHWFDALWSAAATHGGVLEHSAKAARALFAAPQDAAVLHGDIHHGNVLDFGPAGWLAIDPKGLYGERGFDFANILCNPDDAGAQAPGCFPQRIAIISQAAGIERRRLLQWVLAWAGLSATWMIEDGDEPEGRLALARLAASALDGGARVSG